MNENGLLVRMNVRVWDLASLSSAVVIVERRGVFAEGGTRRLRSQGWARAERRGGSMGERVWGCRGVTRSGFVGSDYRQSSEISAAQSTTSRGRGLGEEVFVDRRSHIEMTLTGACND